MGDQLFTAYNYLSSSIAQAFAALIALTAMFYIYRIDTLTKKLSEILTYLKWLVQDSDKLYWLRVNQFPEEKVMELANSRLEEKVFTGVRPEIEVCLEKYKRTKSLRNELKATTVAPLLFSAITMLTGIAALLAGPKICSKEWLYAIMIVESALAALALGWTVVVVIRMLREPGEPKEVKEPEKSTDAKT